MDGWIAAFLNKHTIKQSQCNPKQSNTIHIHFIPFSCTRTRNSRSIECNNHIALLQQTHTGTIHPRRRTNHSPRTKISLLQTAPPRPPPSIPQSTQWTPGWRWIKLRRQVRLRVGGEVCFGAGLCLGGILGVGLRWFHLLQWWCSYCYCYFLGIRCWLLSKWIPPRIVVLIFVLLLVQVNCHGFQS